MAQQDHLPDHQSWNRFWAQGHPGLNKKKSWSKHRIEQLLASNTAVEGKVLDAGCGSGYFSREFSQWGWDVTALDYSREALDVTRRMTEGKVNTLQADLLHDNLLEKLGGQTVSLIFSDGLLEHFKPDDQKRILHNFHSVLEDDGRVATFVPNRWSPWQLIRPFFMPGIQERPLVLSELERLHESSGFRIVSAGGLNVLPVRFSPEFLGPWFGMLLYVVGKKV